MEERQRPSPSRKSTAIVLSLVVVLLLVAVAGGAILAYLALSELQGEQAARLAAETRAANEQRARIEALNAAAQETAARFEAENAAGREKRARAVAESDAFKQTQARIEAEELAAAESTRRVEAETSRAAAEELALAESARRAEAETARVAAEQESQRQKDARAQAVGEVAQEKDARILAEQQADAAEAARRVAERRVEQERSANAALQEDMSQEQTRAEKERVLELAKTHPMVRAIVSGRLTFHLEPLPRYAGEGVSRAVADLAERFSHWEFYGADVKQVQSSSQADITVGWVRDYGSHTIGEAIYRSHIKVGLGATNCVGEWMAFDADTVKKILWHELGHAMGYGHSGDRNNVMYPMTRTRFEVDQSISEVIAGGWYYVTPLCDSGSYSYSFETDDPQEGFDIAALPPGVDAKDYSRGLGRAYAGCGREGMHRYSDTCTVASGSRIYITNTSLYDAIRLTGTIIHEDEPPWPDMTWDPKEFHYDEDTLKGYQELFAD